MVFLLGCIWCFEDFLFSFLGVRENVTGLGMEGELEFGGWLLILMDK
jgi:hypothetical protein